MTVYENVELITGKGGSNHIDSEDFGAYQAATYGRGLYVLGGCELSMDSSVVNIAAGEILMQGRHVRIKPPGAAVPIDTGATDYSRADLICLTYVRDAENDNVETCGLEYLRGTPTTGSSPTDPSYQSGSLLDGASSVAFPLYRITWQGTTPSVTALYHAARALYEEGGALAAFPVGAIYISATNTNPAGFLGGTWAAFAPGRCLVGVDTSQDEFNTVLKTGGHKAMQRHSHTINGSGRLTTDKDGKHSHAAVGGIAKKVAAGAKYAQLVAQSNSKKTATYNTDSEAAHSHGIASHSHTCDDAGSGDAGNLQPYITVFFWRRTA